MAKVVGVLYDDPIEGYPPAYARDDLPRIDRYPDGQALPTPVAARLSVFQAKPIWPRSGR